MNEDEPLLSTPFARARELINSPRYQWNCIERGNVPFVILQYTLEGAGRFSIGGKTHEVPAGSAFIALVPEQAEYFYPAGAGEPWRICWMNFYGDLSMELWGRLRRQFGPVVHIPTESTVAAQLLRLARKAEARQFADRYEASAEAYAFYMNCWRELQQPLLGKNDPVEEALRVCRNHFRDPISVKELAAQCQLSREHFSRIFKERQGIAPAAYLRQQRLEAAAEMLRLSALPVKEIALRTGFYSARQLTKSFQRAYHRSPLQYRREKPKRAKEKAKGLPGNPRPGGR